MTVIALLNVENDPHILADTLLTAEGFGREYPEEVWLPSVGLTSTLRGTKAEPWYIARLGRKTFFLPNYGGVIAFAGHCSAAFDFWAELSAQMMNSASYNPERQVNRDMLDRVLKCVDQGKFSLLGLIKSKNEGWEVFAHNHHKIVTTENFGTCYLAGSGVPLIQAQIVRRDFHVSSSKKPNTIQSISPTENLAEGISADLLYDESDHQSGLERNLSQYSCGGFYEWYGLTQAGVRQMPARLDIHITQADNSPLITRLYLIEPMQQSQSNDEPFPTQKYTIHIINIVLKPTKPVPRDDRGWSVSVLGEEMYGVYIESTFQLYDSRGGSGRLSGLVPKGYLDKFFANPLHVNRVRLICSSGDRAKSRFISRLANEGDVLASLSYEKGVFHIGLNEVVSSTALDALA